MDTSRFIQSVGLLLNLSVRLMCINLWHHYYACVAQCSDWGLGCWRSIPDGGRILAFFIQSRLAVQPTRLRIQWVPEALAEGCGPSLNFIQFHKPVRPFTNMSHCARLIQHTENFLLSWTMHFLTQTHLANCLTREDETDRLSRNVCN